ncbi:MAG: acyl-CoA thioesterase [Bdellovibrionales bacterium]|nr:acyl-CoA thioesterase [Bdellovibrionales bacterium]
MIYTSPYQIHFDECDPAGILFFANAWDICHRVYEGWLLKLKPDWTYWFNNPHWIIPIVNSSCNFHAPLPAGEKIEIQLQLKNLGKSSLHTQFTFRNSDKIFLECQIINVFTSKQTFTKIDIPDEVRKLFDPYQPQVKES